MERIDNAWLNSFICVFEQSSFVKASERLLIPSSTVSRHVQQLEAELGNKLFYRTTRKVTPTSAGEMLYNEIREPLRQLSQTLQNVSISTESMKGSIRVSSPDIPFIGDVLADFALSYPNVSLFCEHSTSIESALNSDPDIVISFERGSLDDRDWVSRPLCQWESSVLASPSCLAEYGSPTTVEELSAMPCISSYKAFAGNPWIFSGPEGLKSVAIKSDINVDGGFIAKAIAVKGLGFVALPREFCRDELDRGSLVEQWLDLELAPLTIYIHYRSMSYHTHLTKLLVSFIRERANSST
ncbi:LysR family transcriptional regulator [Vibrio chagasii]|uniref:LysR family transcriptional regulator n=1 Tax=Vibrio chagasii TaxID=170679 RepID=UPI001EFC35C2|nr:LysR family transcriptional regulator [Vibrio chagasii]MCG9673085.1 LysR family transcriptional regulator [Vibrio chagasii]CAH6866059.1 LysR family transcriptional regulator [Vibrio chagasii]CAH7096253.1 LysR family transcriptional regulator [Vibrio chagasii]CAH7103508.1 LysR family transcriptional regulator [Vibrio chagasii]CAH7107867.1 LysR family transcriptional regulator [Vibrio chagasii]